jgi:hypothetical protein
MQLARLGQGGTRTRSFALNVPPQPQRKDTNTLQHRADISPYRLGISPRTTCRARCGGLALLRSYPELLGLLTLTWFFNLLYGPAEVALTGDTSEPADSGPAASDLGTGRGHGRRCR